MSPKRHLSHSPFPSLFYLQQPSCPKAPSSAADAKKSPGIFAPTMNLGLSAEVQSLLSRDRSTKVKHLFRHPVERNKSDVKKYLCETQQDYEDCQVEINKHEAIIKLLQAKQAALERAMKKYRKLSSSVYQFPSETLLEIFRYCCEDNVLCEGEMAAATTLSAVCGRWREIVLASPVLWSSISLTLHDSEEYLEDGPLAILTRLFLERSNPKPLKLQLDFPYNPEADRSYEPWAIIDLLEAHSERWQVLEIYGTEIYASSESGEIDLPILKRVALYTSSPEGSNSQLPLDRFINCTTLVSFSTDAAGTESRLSLPWVNLRTVELDGCTTNSTLTVLSSCTSLEQLVIANVRDKGEPWRGDRFVAHTIQSLSIQAQVQYATDVDPSVVEHFALPGLSSLNISTDLLKHPVHERFTLSDRSCHLERFIRRSSCTITSLRLHSVMFTDTQVISLLRLMPELNSLEIGEYRGQPPNRIVTRQLSAYLLVDPNICETPSLPHLTELKLIIHVDGLDQLALAGALTSRWAPLHSIDSDVGAGVDCLTSVEIALLSKEEVFVTQGSLSSLQCFRDAGVRFRISHVVAGNN